MDPSSNKSSPEDQNILGSIPMISLLDVLRDFTIINNTIYHSTNSSIKDTIKKCQILSEQQVLYIRRRLAMNQVRHQKGKRSGQVLQRKSKSQIRFLITDVLKRYPSLSYSQLAKETGLAYQTILNFVKQDRYYKNYVCINCGESEFSKRDFKTKNIICVKPIGDPKENKVCNSYTELKITSKEPEERLLKVAKTGAANYVSLRSKEDFS